MIQNSITINKHNSRSIFRRYIWFLLDRRFDCARVVSEGTIRPHQGSNSSSAKSMNSWLLPSEVHLRSFMFFFFFRVPEWVKGKPERSPFPLDLRGCNYSTIISYRRSPLTESLPPRDSRNALRAFRDSLGREILSGNFGAGGERWAHLKSVIL